MPNYFVPSLRTKTAKCGDGEKIKKRNSEFQGSRDDVGSQNLLKPGNISHLAATTFKLGEKGSGTRPLGELQDYNVLRKQCLAEGQLFEDSEFPARPSSVYGSKPPEKEIEWKRPPGLVPYPKLFVEGPSRFDVNQNHFGDCWFLAALANLAMNKPLLTRVVPEDQGFDKDYAGIFHFRFWQYGRWVEVVIDDRLPMWNGKLMGLHSAPKTEFWTALLEKAYAKLHGSYAAIEGGYPGDAMEDFTSGVAETHYDGSYPEDLFDVLLKAHEKNALLSCSFKEVEGLYEGHAYSITKVRWVSKGTENEEKIAMVRVRNPWGTGEWRGAWSDNSQEWQSISAETKNELVFRSADDGEFWMCFQDFTAHSDRIFICYLNPNSVPESPSEKEWEISVFEGEWVSGVTAGGCRDNMEMFQHNPQYLMTLEEECTVIVALMQKNPTIQGAESADFLSIGFEMIRLEKDPSKEIPRPLDSDYLEDGDVEWVDIDACKQKSAPDAKQFEALRQVNCRVTLRPGSYCIIPSTYETDKDGEFILRVFSEEPHKIEEYHEELGVDEVDNSKTNKHQDESLRDYFRLISGDDRQLDWLEQKKVLDCTISSELLNNNGISKDACRSMVALLDVDRSGKLSFGEFQTFWKDVKNLVGVFEKTSSTDDGVEYLSTLNLKKALNEAGLHVNIHILGKLVRRYGTGNKKITLEDFIICALRIKNMLGIFKERDHLKSDVAKFTLDEWMDNTLYL